MLAHGCDGPLQCVQSMDSISSLIDSLCARVDLERTDAKELFAQVVAGKLNDIELTAMLVALKSKGETPEEIAGAAEALRGAAQSFKAGTRTVVDSCGTGGDGSGTLNISTAVGIVAAEIGLHVVKHGNRSISSRCGSADVLEACGVRIDASPRVARACLDQERICFLFAPQYHQGVRYAMPVRRALGVRTIFNMVGPLINPASPQRQLMGVYDKALCVPVAQTLNLLGLQAAVVVHGCGLDEIALHGPTTAAVLRDGFVSEVTWTPRDFGLQQAPLDALSGGDREYNGAWLRAILEGGGTVPQQHAIAANCGALLWICDVAGSLEDGAERVLAALETGAAARRLARWATCSHASDGEMAGAS